MKVCLEACAEHDIEFVVLDRPNPLGGERIEGPGLTKEFESFVGTARRAVRARDDDGRAGAAHARRVRPGLSRSCTS